MTEKTGLLEAHSNLTGELISKLQERNSLVIALVEIKENISAKKSEFQLRLSELDKDQLKEFGSNAEIRAAKVEESLKDKLSTLKTFENSLRNLDLEIEILKLQKRHVAFEKDVLLEMKGELN